MTTAKTRKVPVMLGGQERNLCVDLNALDLVHEETGVNILQDQSVLNNPTPRNLIVLIWAFLVHDEPDLNAVKDEDGEWDEFVKDSKERRRAIRKVGHWCEIGVMAELGEAVMRAVEESMPEPELNGVGESAQGNEVSA